MQVHHSTRATHPSTPCLERSQLLVQLFEAGDPFGIKASQPSAFRTCFQKKNGREIQPRYGGPPVYRLRDNHPVVRSSGE